MVQDGHSKVSRLKSCWPVRSVGKIACLNYESNGFPTHSHPKSTPGNEVLEGRGLKPHMMIKGHVVGPDSGMRIIWPMTRCVVFASTSMVHGKKHLPLYKFLLGGATSDMT